MNFHFSHDFYTFQDPKKVDKKKVKVNVAAKKEHRKRDMDAVTAHESEDSQSEGHQSFEDGDYEVYDQPNKKKVKVNHAAKKEHRKRDMDAMTAHTSNEESDELKKTSKVKSSFSAMSTASSKSAAKTTESEDNQSECHQSFEDGDYEVYDQPKL